MIHRLLSVDCAYLLESARISISGSRIEDFCTDMFRPRRPSPGSPRQQLLRKTAAKSSEHNQYTSGYSRTHTEKVVPSVPYQDGPKPVSERGQANDLPAEALAPQSNRHETFLSTLQKSVPSVHGIPAIPVQDRKHLERASIAFTIASQACRSKDNSHPEKETSNVTSSRALQVETKKRPASGNPQLPRRSESVWKEWPGNDNAERLSPKSGRAPYKIPKLINNDTANFESGSPCSGKEGSSNAKEAKKRHIKVLERYLVLRRPQGVWKDWDDDDKINTIRWFGAHPEDMTPATVAKWQMPEPEMWPFFGDGAWQMPSVRMELWLRPVQSEIMAEKSQSMEKDNRTAEVFNWDSVGSEVQSGGSDL